jgi:hypothetical protein
MCKFITRACGILRSLDKRGIHALPNKQVETTVALKREQQQQQQQQEGEQWHEILRKTAFSFWAILEKYDDMTLAEKRIVVGHFSILASHKSEADSKLYEIMSGNMTNAVDFVYQCDSPEWTFARVCKNGIFQYTTSDGQIKIESEEFPISMHDVVKFGEFQEVDYVFFPRIHELFSSNSYNILDDVAATSSWTCTGTADSLGKRSK